jgi:hypothetical protein
MSTLAGVAILISGFGLLRAFRLEPGQSSARGEWLEITVAITVTAAMGVGLMLVIGEIGGLVLSRL